MAGSTTHAAGTRRLGPSAVGREYYAANDLISLINLGIQYIINHEMKEKSLRNVENHKTGRTLGLIAHIRSELNRFATTDAASWFGRDLAEYHGVRCVPRFSSPKAAKNYQAQSVVSGTQGAASAA